jgi:colanic acid/amylovoran biosynthesis protein
LIFSKFIPILLNKKLILAPQTIGPFNNHWREKLAVFLMKRAYSVYSRDFKTSQLLDKCNINFKEVSDVAFKLPYKKQLALPNSIGINVSGLLWNGGYTKKNQFSLGVDYPKFIRKLIDGMLTRGQRVHLIGHVIDENQVVEDDYRVCQELESEYDSDNVILAPRFKSAIEVKEYISQLTFFTGARMHATIAAVSSGVPTIPLAYSRKFSGVFGSLDYNYTIDLHENSSEAAELAFFNNFDNNIVLMKEGVIRAKSLADDKLEPYILDLVEVLKNAIN